MKQCPKCQSNISDTAKFCVKCGCNIKKHEEEQAQAYFCPECGTKFSGGMFCPECGFDVRNELNGQPALAETDTFGDGWLFDLESNSSADVATMQAQKAKEQTGKKIAAFEYDEHTDGTYTIIALKDLHALNIIVPEGVVSIGDYAFEGCEAFNISLPEGLLKIGNAAFKNSADLSSINLPQSLISIGDEAFAECESLDIKIPNSVRKVGNDVILNTLQDKKRKAELAKWEVGGTPMVGSYYKDGSGSRSPIEWIVLERNGNEALVISKYGIDCKPYNSDRKATTWETSSLRKWLNGEFINKAFSVTERQRIQSTTIVTPKNGNADGGNSTCDKLFLLSIEEFNQYVTSDEKMLCIPTAYAVSNGAVKYTGRSYGWWWLRSPGCYSQESCAFVADGIKYTASGATVDSENGCVRPAMWITLDISRS